MSDEVERRVTRDRRFAALARRIEVCVRCTRLREHCRAVARDKRRAYSEWDYWAKPVAGFGDPAARIWILGLAPAAHGANRTGRVFTGDRSGDFLFAALHRAGLANQPVSISRGDGLALHGVFVSAAVRCAPPENRPTPSEIEACASFLDVERRDLRDLRVILCLGALAWNAALALESRGGIELPIPRPKFRHGGSVRAGRVELHASYHVSQQNTFTGKLTPAMFDDVLRRARTSAGAG